MRLLQVSVETTGWSRDEMLNPRPLTTKAFERGAFGSVRRGLRAWQLFDLYRGVVVSPAGVSFGGQAISGSKMR